MRLNRSLKPTGPVSGENHLLSNGKEAYYYGSPIPKSAESPARHSQPKALMPASLALGPLHFAACGGTGHLKPPGPLSGDKYSHSLLPQPHCGWKSNGHDPPWIEETFSDWLLSKKMGEPNGRDPPWPSGKQTSGLPIGQALASEKISTQPLDRTNPAHLALRQKAVPTKNRSRVSFYLSVSMADKKLNKKPPLAIRRGRGRGVLPTNCSRRAWQGSPLVGCKGFPPKNMRGWKSDTLFWP